MRPLVLDLFCCAGGVSKGLHDAGFDVVGVDIEPQPEYVHPGRFVQADALNPPFDLRRFAFIWASPPCQDSSVGSQRWKVAGRVYPQLIPATRAMLEASGVPYCIENVVGAPIRPDLVLTGPMFGLKTYRRRHFEFGGACSPGSRRSRQRGGRRPSPGFSQRPGMAGMARTARGCGLRAWACRG